MSLAIETQGLTKVFGRARALDGLDLAVETGSVFGFLGPNGAGKTTTLRILTGLARPSGGSAEVLGMSIRDNGPSIRRSLGYLPDVPGYYPWMRGDEFLKLSGSLFGLSGRELDLRVAALLELAGLAGVRTKIGGYSRGMRQRLGVAQALVSSPPLLLLDEPTSALDPMGRRDVLGMIGALRGKTTVFFSTHILSDVERVCDTVAIIDKGRVVRQASIEELKSGGPDRNVEVTVAGDPAAFVEAARMEPWASSVVQSGPVARIAVSDIDAARTGVVRIAARLGVGVVRLEEREPSLEEVFVDLVEGSA